MKVCILVETHLTRSLVWRWEGAGGTIIVLQNKFWVTVFSDFSIAVGSLLSQSTVVRWKKALFVTLIVLYG